MEKGILSRDEQATFVRLFASLVSSGRSVAEALYTLADDWRERGVFNFRVPLFPKLQKGFVADVLEEAAYDVTQGVKAEEVIARLPLLDEDVRRSLARAVASGQVEEMSQSLADVLEEEAKLRGKIKSVAFTPAMVLVVSYVILFVVCFKLAPSIGNVVTHPERLPAGAKLALFVNKHPVYYYGYVGGSLFLVFLFVKSGVWKVFIPAFREFDRIKFLMWLKTLTESGMRLYDALVFLSEGGFSKELKERLENTVDDLEAGIKPENALDNLKGQLKTTDLSFLKTGLTTGDLSRELSPLLRVLKIEVNKSIEKSVNLINTAMLVVGGLLVLGIYAGLIVPLTMGIQKAM